MDGEIVSNMYKIYIYNAERFISFEQRMDSIEVKLNWILSLIIGAIVIPASLHMLKLL